MKKEKPAESFKETMASLGSRVASLQDRVREADKEERRLTEANCRFQLELHDIRFEKQTLFLALNDCQRLRTELQNRVGDLEAQLQRRSQNYSLNAVNAMMSGVRTEIEKERDEARDALAKVKSALTQAVPVKHCGAHFSDIEVASMVRMLMRDDLDHEMVCVTARDRINHLSERIAAALNITT